MEFGKHRGEVREMSEKCEEFMEIGGIQGKPGEFLEIWGNPGESREIPHLLQTWNHSSVLGQRAALRKLRQGFRKHAGSCLI